MSDTANVKLTYFFCPQLPVDPKWHKDVYLWNEVIKIHKSIAVKFIEDDPSYFKQTFTATRIIWQSIDKNTFIIDPKLVQQPMPKF